MATADDRIYMARALQLAQCGEGAVSPNPMVGAVIVHQGRIIGEGYHEHYGGPHAEVNAVRSVREDDLPLLRESTVYVTLEPCSHYGKTPPCAKLLCEVLPRRVVVAAMDPFPQVAGRGLQMLRDAGIEVETGVLEPQARWQNRRFFTAHTLQRPYVTLKWAQDSQGRIAALDDSGKPVQTLFSTPLTKGWVHRLRAVSDAIMVGTNTVNIDNPRLHTTRWPGPSPRPVTFDRHGRLNPQSRLCLDLRTIVLRERQPLGEMLRSLYADHGITSLMVEGGAQLLRSFMVEGCWDEARIETAPIVLPNGPVAPRPGGRLLKSSLSDGNLLEIYVKKI